MICQLDSQSDPWGHAWLSKEGVTAICLSQEVWQHSLYCIQKRNHWSALQKYTAKNKNKGKCGTSLGSDSYVNVRSAACNVKPGQQYNYHEGTCQPIDHSLWHLRACVIEFSVPTVLTPHCPWDPIDSVALKGIFIRRTAHSTRWSLCKQKQGH